MTEVANLFGASADTGANFGSEIYPGYPGLVVAEGRARIMTWGFPLVLKGKSGQPLKPKPANNARTDKLDSFMWRFSFQERHCLIPVSAWAEAQGSKGVMTRTWPSLPGGEPFAVAGVWCATAEGSDADAMVMSDCCELTADIHERILVLLSVSDWERVDPRFAG